MPQHHMLLLQGRHQQLIHRANDKVGQKRLFAALKPLVHHHPFLRVVGVILHRGEKSHIGLAVELQCVHILQLDVVAVLVGQRDEIGAEFVLHGGNLLC